VRGAGEKDDTARWRASAPLALGRARGASYLLLQGLPASARAAPLDLSNALGSGAALQAWGSVIACRTAGCGSCLLQAK
jgi:hypothetical protein